MSILIDSAKENEVRQAQEMGWVKGITTNPTILAQAGRPASESLALLASLNIGPIYYQLVADTLEGMVEEARLAYSIVGEPLVLKIPPVTHGFRFVARHHSEYPCCVTALYSPAQALVASQAGAKSVVVYVNRATRMIGDGATLVRQFSAVLKGTETEILAASVKSPEEASAAVEAGANHLTLPFDVLQMMTMHSLSEDAVAQFNAKGIGLIN